MKSIFVIAFLIFFSNTYAQLSVEKNLAKTKLYFLEHSTMRGNKGIIYAKEKNILSFISSDIPISDVDISDEIRRFNGSFINVVYFHCVYEGESCITSYQEIDSFVKIEYVNGIGIPFDSKESCVEFIRLLHELINSDINIKK